MCQSVGKKSLSVNRRVRGVGVLIRWLILAKKYCFLLDVSWVARYTDFTVTIKDRLIALCLRLALFVVRGLVYLKPYVLTFLSVLLLPGRVLWAIFLSLGIPVYGTLYALRKQVGDLYQPAKNRLMYRIANRYTVHAIVAFVLLVAFGFNLQASAVRAETFGEDSLMYALVVNEGERFIEQEVVLESVAAHTPTSYLEDIGLASRTYGVTSSDAVGANVFATSSGLSAPRAMQGADSVAPREEIITYAVEEGDTLSDIAAKFNISLNTLLWSNNLSARSSIRTGKELTILPVSGVTHTVGKGETMTKIASRYGVKIEEIYAFNKLSPDDAISVGTKLVVPGGEIKAIASAPSSVGRVFAAPSGGKPGAGGGSGTGTGSMLWPTDLRVITQYFGWKHTGIDVDCKFTNDNYAADAGTVIFAGWKGGYGYAVDIDHGGGLTTRYGHHASLYVSTGDVVARGAALGRCGTTGRSTGTHLHFEVRQNGSLRNPLEYVR